MTEIKPNVFRHSRYWLLLALVPVCFIWICFDYMQPKKGWPTGNYLVFGIFVAVPAILGILFALNNFRSYVKFENGDIVVKTLFRCHRRTLREAKQVIFQGEKLIILFTDGPTLVIQRMYRSQPILEQKIFEGIYLPEEASKADDPN